MPRTSIRARCAYVIFLLAWCAFTGTSAASDHPGNVYLAGSDVHIVLPADWNTWQAVDVDQNVVAKGATQEGTADLGKLPVGYYEVRQVGGPGRITSAVIADTSSVEDTPIALDAGMAWFYADAEQLHDACRLCRLAGVHWVRDRASWPELETAPGTWAPEGRYERALRIEHDEGLKVLQVNHISPAWAAENPARFPQDLHLVYSFYRGLAERWQGLVDAIEPWNEPDIKLFGGHTGCEIASFHKAAYLGIKAGNPQQLVCGTVFAIDRAETLNEFAANLVYPYFERYDLHHYIGLPAYSRAYGRHRATSGGRPLWTTEFNLPVSCANPQTREPTEEQLRVQGFRVGKVFAQALFEGTQKAFYFIFGDYVERNLQFGLVHSDLTPRPAFVAFAAVGRFLNGAEPIGRADLGDEKLKGYIFRTVVDKTPRETLVAWSETHPTKIDIPRTEKIYDYLGRQLSSGGKVELSRETVYMILPRGGSQGLEIEPAPSKAEWRSGEEPCPVVLQLIGNGDVDRSAFRLDDTNGLRLIAYNFSDQAVQGVMQVDGATLAEDAIQIEPKGRLEQTIHIDSAGVVTVRLELGELGNAIVSANVMMAEPESESSE